MSRIDERPEYRHLRAFKKIYQWDLMKKHGAHGMGIGFLEEVGASKSETPGSHTQELALLFYVDSLSDQANAAEPVPTSFSFLPEDAEKPVELRTRVVEAPRAQDEVEEE